MMQRLRADNQSIRKPNDTIRNSYFFSKRPRLMKAFIVSFVFHDLEVPFSDSERGCQYTNVHIKYIVTDKTAGAAKYQVICDLIGDEYLNCYYDASDMFRMGTVRRTKRKYKHTYTRRKLLQYNT